MKFTGFTEEDFNVFHIEGLDARMEALKSSVRPKLEQLGHYFSPTLATMTGNEIFPHVAKHARRTINPPKDTWVAFGSSPRGYKMLPHFQIGLWESHIFIWFAMIYEAPNKAEFGKTLKAHIDEIYSSTPAAFVWSSDHMKPEAVRQDQLSKEELLAMFERLSSVKKAEILCGYHIPRDEAVKLTGDELLAKIEDVFIQVLPLYKLA